MKPETKERRALFDLGRVVATPGGLKAIVDGGHNPADFLERHQSGDWGEVCRADAQANNRALKDGARILSTYWTRKDVRLWVITEADRSSTCILLPEEY